MHKIWCLLFTLVFASAALVASPEDPGNGGEEEFEVAETAFHHISNTNAFHVFGDFYLPLPVILYTPETGEWVTGMSSMFEAHHHGNGTKAVDGFVLIHGEIKRILDPKFPMGVVDLGDDVKVGHQLINPNVPESLEDGYHEDERSGSATGNEPDEKMEDMVTLTTNGNTYLVEDKTYWDGNVLGGGVSSFIDFSLTKNVFTMIVTSILLFLIFFGMARRYKKHGVAAPKGIQSLLEPIVVFMRDEVAEPFLHHKADKYLPFILTVFFFILGLNLIGQIPFFPGSGNVTGNLAVTAVLAIFAFLVVNLSGNRHYWGHILWMPGVPWWVKVFVLTPVEVAGVFIKPFTLMLRLFANITAGHIVIIAFVGLIFIFGGSGDSVPGSIAGIIAAVPLTLFMMSIELLVAFIQAFVFALLTASYIGAAVEEAHH